MMANRKEMSCHTRGQLNKALQPLQYGLLGLGTDHPVDLGAVLQDKQGRDALNAESCRCPRISIDV